MTGASAASAGWPRKQAREHRARRQRPTGAKRVAQSRRRASAWPPCSFLSRSRPPGPAAGFGPRWSCRSRSACSSNGCRSSGSAPAARDRRASRAWGGRPLYCVRRLEAALVGSSACAVVADRAGWSASGRRRLCYAAAAMLPRVLVRHDQQYGFVALLLVLAVVWASDIGGYFAGKSIGGPKLAPRISRTRHGPARSAASR